MTSRILAVVALALIGCGKDEPLDPEILSFTVDPMDIPAGGTATATVEVENFELGGHHDDTTMTMGVDHGDETAKAGEVQTGHVHIYLDDVETNPLVMMMSESETFMIPMDAEVGVHVLIARLQDEDHLIIEPEVTAELEINVLDATMTGTMR